MILERIEIRYNVRENLIKISITSSSISTAFKNHRQSLPKWQYLANVKRCFVHEKDDKSQKENANAP